MAAFTLNEALGEMLRKAVAERQREMAEGLALGSAPDYVAYQRKVGIHQGLHDALDILAECEKKLAER